VADVPRDEGDGDRDETELDLERGRRPLVEMAGERGPGRELDRQGNERSVAEAPGDCAQALALRPLDATERRHDGEAEEELAADEERHAQQVRDEDPVPDVQGAPR
jgi:hypothetical protein